MATVHVRHDSEIRYLRRQTPYGNWLDGAFSQNAHSHPSQRDPITSPPQGQGKSNWIEEKARGSRHILDVAPFSLWDDKAHDYVDPTHDNIRWILQAYNATAVEFIAPFLLIATDTPSLPEHHGQTSLTIGSTPVIFTSPEALAQGFHSGKPRPNANHYVDRLMEDPLKGNYQAIPWTQPSAEDAEKVWGVLKDICTVHALNFVWPDLIIELAEGQRIYKTESLPPRLGGWIVSYHHGGPFWKSSIPMARRRELTAASSQKDDTTNYLRIGDGIIGPGVRVEGAIIASSAGVRIRDRTRVRITLADRSFEDCANVYHPDGDAGDSIATIQERYPDHDWALAKLHPSVNFSNSRVFECPQITKLLAGHEVSKHEWFVCDGMTTGKIAMTFQGKRWVGGKTSKDVIVDLSSLEPASVYFGLAPTGGAPDLRAGICGAPIVHEKTGGIAGFFQFMDEGGWCFAPQLDKLIEDG